MDRTASETTVSSPVTGGESAGLTASEPRSPALPAPSGAEARGQAGDSAPPWYRSRSVLVFSAPMIANGIAMPFYPVWLASLSFDKAMIGIILSVPVVVRLISGPAMSFLADRMRERMTVLLWSGLLSFASALALFFADGFWPVTLLFALQGAVYAPYVPLAESLLATGVRRWGYDYGQLRFWGSIAFILANLAGGLIIGQIGDDAILPILAFCFGLCGLMGFVAPRLGGLPARTQAASGRAGGGARGLKRADLHLVMFGSALVQGSHALLFTFSSIYWGTLGFSGGAIGFLWSAGVIAEVFSFRFARNLNRWLSPWQLLMIGAGVAIFRWIAFPAAHHYLAFVALQALHAFSFAFCHIGIQRLIVSMVSERQEASAQGTYFFYNGLTTAIVTFLSGYLYAALGLQAFFSMAGLATLGLAAILVARGAQNRARGRRPVP